MRVWDKQRNSRKKRKLSKKTQTRSKKGNRNCCVRCWYKVCGRCCKRFNIFVTKKMFGISEPQWADYEFAGVDLDNLKHKFSFARKRSSLRNESTILTLYKTKKPFSKTNISVNHLDLIEGYEADDLKKKFSIKGSRIIILEQLVDDYKKGNVSSSGLKNESKYNFKKLDKDQMNKILDDYKQKKYNKRKSLKDMNFEDIKRRFSIRESKDKSLDNLITQYKNGHVSKSAFIRKLNEKNLSKERVSDVFQDLKQKRKTSVKKISKFKEFDSLMRLKSVFQNGIRK